MNRKELNKIKQEAQRLGIKWKTGYCDFQDDKLTTWDMIEIGKNYGMYGWNWTLYYSPSNNTFYCNGYRNM